MSLTPPTPWRKPEPMPDPVALTERLVARWFVRTDAEALRRVVDASRATLLPYLPWAREAHRTAEESTSFIDGATRNRSLVEADDFVMGVFEREGGALVGGTGFHRVDPATATAEIGYWISADHRRLGYATECSAGLLTAGFHDWGFRRIKICCAPENLASVGVAERLRMRREGLEVEDRWFPDTGFTSTITYALLDREWDRR